jgi:hypothetical protein
MHADPDGLHPSLNLKFSLQLIWNRSMHLRTKFLPLFTQKKTQKKGKLQQWRTAQQRLRAVLLLHPNW